MIKIHEAREIWQEVLEENMNKLCQNSSNLINKLKNVSFLPGGVIRSNRYGRYVIKHFPSLVHEYEIKLEKKKPGELFWDL